MPFGVICAWLLARPYQALFAVLVFVLVRCSHSVNQVYQRCNVGYDDEAPPGWETSMCQACRENTVPVVLGQVEENKKKDITLYAHIQITIPKLEPELLNLAAGLLMNQTNAVTIAYVTWLRGTNDDYDHVLRRRILSKIPCSSQTEEHRLEERLKIRPIDMAPPIRSLCSNRVNATLAYLEPVRSCISALAPTQYRHYSRIFQKLQESNQKIPHVFVTDMHGYGALAAAEEFGIPALVLMDQHSFYESTGQTAGQNPSMQHRIESVIFKTIRAVMGAKTFADFNRFRSIVGLKRLKHPRALWNSATVVAVLAHEFNASAPMPKASFPPLLHLQNPIFPPCVPCLDSSSITMQQPALQPSNTVTVLFLPPWDLSVSWSRQVIRGLSIARRSLLSYQGPWGDVATSNLWHDRIDLRVKLIVDTDLSNHIFKATKPLPSFVQPENATLFLDNLIRSNEEGLTIVLADCDNEARAALLLGISVLCLASRAKSQQSRPCAKVYHLPNFEAREIAMHVTQLVWNLKTPEASLAQWKSTQGDSLHRLVTVINGAGRYLAQAANLPRPKNAEAVSAESLQVLLRTHFSREETFITATHNKLSLGLALLWWACYTFLALCVFSLLALLVLPSTCFKQLSTNVHNGFGRGRGSWVEGFVDRFPELHDAWNSVKNAWKGGEKPSARRAVLLNTRQKQKQQRINEGVPAGSNGVHRKRIDKEW